MSYVYLLQHSYEYGDNLEFSETKIIGIYSSRSLAEDVIEKYIKLPGFKDHSIEDFYIDEYKIDENNWEEGFITT